MNLFQLFAGSFHSAAAYRYMRAKASFGMGYALFVVALVTFFVTLYFGLIVYTAAFTSSGDQQPLFDRVIHDMAAQAPIMTLKDDTLATKNPEPTIMHLRVNYKDDKFDTPLVTIDTSGKATTETTDTTVLVTDKQLFIRSGKGWKAQPLSDFTKNSRNVTKGNADTIIINHAVADEMATNFIQYIRGNLVQYFIIFWLVAMTCLFVVSFFILFTLGIVGIVIGTVIRSPLTFGAAVALASLSFTPVALLDAVLLIFFDHPPHIGTLLLAGSVTLYAAIRCSDPVTPAVRA